MPPDPSRAPADESAERDVDGASGEGPPAGSPYKNLWAPLVIVPALVVMVLALVGLLFGAIGGEPRRVEDYIEALSGGRNERQQALFGLSQRIAENALARLEGDEGRWDVDREALLPLLEEAWASAREEDHELRYVLAALAAQLGSPEGVPRLLSLLLLSEAEDPGAALRFVVLANLAALGDERALPALEEHARDEDVGLRSIAVMGLQKLPLEKVRGALQAALGDEALQVRGNAAIALSKLGDPAGAAVLRDLLGAEAYAAEEERDPRRFAGGAQVGESRIKALEALARLRRAQDRELVLRIAEDDPDVNLRGAAKRALEGWEGVDEGGD